MISFVGFIGALTCLTLINDTSNVKILTTVQKVNASHKAKKQRKANGAIEGDDGYDVLPRKSNTPKVKKFTRKLIDKYYLMGSRWPSTTIKYNDDANEEYKPLVDECIKMINDLGLIKLVKSSESKADSTITLIYSKKECAEAQEDLGYSGDSGVCRACSTHYYNEKIFKHRGLKCMTNASIYLFVGTLIDRGRFEHDDPSENYEKLPSDSVERKWVINNFEKATCHEIGHALGLNHSWDEEEDTMYGWGSFVASDSTYEIDQNYRNQLAVIYEN